MTGLSLYIRDLAPAVIRTKAIVDSTRSVTTLDSTYTMQGAHMIDIAYAHICGWT